MTKKTKQRTGAAGALLDLYEEAISGLQEVVRDIQDDTLTVIIDPETKDENCRSFQAILSHVLSSGYGYATSIHNRQGHAMERPAKKFYQTTGEYLTDLSQLFMFTEQVFSTIKDTELEEFNDALKIKTGWGQLYDIEQLTEHAIVHILRHKRQIENIKRKGWQ
jgi:uncharacterized damage-inducible protein DinB